MKLLNSIQSHGGEQRVYSHWSESCQCEMTFAIYLPPQAKEQGCPTLTFLSGLTCSHANVMEKGEYRQAAAEHGLIIVCPDTSPRGETIANDKNYYAGQGAGFYLNATQAPFKQHFQMESYITEELPQLVREHFPVSDSKDSIFGHSMGGHGALTLALKHPNQYCSASAFAPICSPIQSQWGQYTLPLYLGATEGKWRDADAVALIEDGHRFTEFLVDQGLGDNFLDEQLKPHLLKEACQQAGIPLTLRRQDGYDHSYYFISTFMTEHIAWHAERLSNDNS